MSITVTILIVLATARLTRLIVVDQITAPFRRWAQQLDRISLADAPRFTVANERWPRLAYWTSCPWCVSPYIAAALTTLVLIWPTNRAILGALIALTASLAAGFIQQFEDLLDDRHADR
jgi:hypothetical protein